MNSNTIYNTKPSKVEADRISREKEFIRRSKERFGDKFDYSLVHYINNNTVIRLICNMHGEVRVNPYSHLKSYTGCKKCGLDKSTEKRSSNQKDVIKKFKEVHGDKYDYSLVEYKNTHTKVTIKCPIHGEFRQTPKTHLSGQECRDCGKLKYLKSKHKKHEDSIIERFKEVHGDKYDYSLVEYKRQKDKVKVKCPTHGIFEINAGCHLRGRGCQKCAIEHRAKLNTVPQEKLLKQFHEAHGNRYDYSLVETNGIDKKVKIICPSHGVFEQTPKSHRHGEGCPTCGLIQCQSTWYKNTYNADDIRDVQGMLYLIKVTNKETGRQFYKFGITSTTIEYRFARLNSAGFSYEVINFKESDIVSCIEEEIILSSYLDTKGLLYKIHDFKDQNTNGWSECFPLSVGDETLSEIIERFYS